METTSIEELLLESNGELPLELEERINQLELDTKQKVDKVTHVLNSLDMHESYLRERAKDYEKAARVADNAIEAFKNRIKELMRASGVKTIEGTDVKITLKDTKPKLVITDDSKLTMFEEIVTKTEVNKAKVKEMLESGIAIDGASLVNSGSISIKIKTR